MAEESWPEWIWESVRSAFSPAKDYLFPPYTEKRMWDRDTRESLRDVSELASFRNELDKVASGESLYPFGLRDYDPSVKSTFNEFADTARQYRLFEEYKKEAENQRKLEERSRILRERAEEEEKRREEERKRLETESAAPRFKEQLEDVVTGKSLFPLGLKTDDPEAMKVYGEFSDTARKYREHLEKKEREKRNVSTVSSAEKKRLEMERERERLLFKEDVEGLSPYESLKLKGLERKLTFGQKAKEEAQEIKKERLSLAQKRDERVREKGYDSQVKREAQLRKRLTDIEKQKADIRRERELYGREQTQEDIDRISSLNLEANFIFKQLDTLKSKKGIFPITKETPEYEVKYSQGQVEDIKKIIRSLREKLGRKPTEAELVEALKELGL